MLAIQAVSVALFEDRGFENVTVEEVASQSQVSPSTLYRYFGTKESLVVWDDLDRLMEAALETHLGRDEPFGDLKRAFVGAYSDLSKEELLALRRRADLIDREPALLAAQVAALHTAQEQLLPVLAKVYKRGKRGLGSGDDPAHRLDGPGCGPGTLAGRTEEAQFGELRGSRIFCGGRRARQTLGSCKGLRVLETDQCCGNPFSNWEFFSTKGVTGPLPFVFVDGTCHPSGPGDQHETNHASTFASHHLPRLRFFVRLRKFGGRWLQRNPRARRTQSGFDHHPPMKKR